MNDRPVIGVTTQTLQAIDGIPPGIPNSWLMNHRYFTALTSVGAVPWMVPLLAHDTTTLRAIYEHLDGIFLPGGVDVDPASYGAEREPCCGRTDVPRDEVELALTRWALDEGKPVLGVCRGMQIVNVARGGTLVQDCETGLPAAIKHDYFPTQGYERDHLAHTIRVAPDSRLAAAFGAETVRVNSMHHQGIATLGAGLSPTAWAEDGLVEALEADAEGYAVAVQWHPEMLIDSDAGTRRLFETFIHAALEFRATGVAS